MCWARALPQPTSPPPRTCGQPFRHLCSEAAPWLGGQRFCVRGPWAWGGGRLAHPEACSPALIHTLHTCSMQRWLAGGAGWGGGEDEQTRESVPSGSFLSIRNAGPEVRAERGHEVVFLPFLQRDPGRGPTIWLGPAAPSVSPLLPDGLGLGGLSPGLRTRVTGG